jgi:methyltransferase (TIGR00027 family)
MNTTSQRPPVRAHDEVIGSAETVAFARALAALDPDPALRCPDHLAERLIGEPLRAMLADPAALRAELDRRFPGIYPFHIARTKFTDQVLRDEVAAGVRQVVVLGAGLDTRAWRFEQLLADTRVFELDFPGNQRQKRERLARAGLATPPNLAFVPIDFARDALDTVLHGAGLEPGAATLFIWDGVSYYLDEASVRAVLRYVGTTAGAPRSVVFDYALRSFVEGDRSPYGGPQIAAYFSAKGEPFLFGLDAGEVAPFLQGCGLRVQADLGPDELGARFADPGKGLPRLPFVGVYRMVHARADALPGA